MLSAEVPGRGRVEIAHLVLDLNGTLAVDGAVRPTVVERLRRLGGSLQIHVVTADTFGSAAKLRDLAVQVRVLDPGDHVQEKAALVRALGPSHTVAIGNGSNDEGMLREAAVAIAVVGPEGASLRAVLEADVVVTSPEDALDLLLVPQRLVATLRTR